MTFTLYNGLTVLLTVVLAAVSLALLLERSAPGRPGARIVSRTAGRFAGPGAFRRWTWVHVAAVVAAGYALVVGFDLATGLYACHPGTGTADLLAMVDSGRAFWAGGNPFTVTDCGASVAIPYGLAAVLLDAAGSLGGAAGVAAVWGIVALALVPLVWLLAEDDRRYLTLVAAVSPIYFPLVSSQIDGASNAIVPVAVLLAVLLARRPDAFGPIVGGFLSTARFPSMFAVLASSGARPRRFLLAGIAVVTFVTVTGLTYARWGAAFVDVVFLSQVSRHSFSLNAFGILLNAHALPGGMALPVAQAVLTLGIVVAAFLTVRSPLRSAAIALTGVALLTQFLSFSILLWLLPVVLVGQRERWWLWGIALVGAMNYDLALNVVGSGWGIYWPTDLLDAVLTALLVGLFVDLWRGARRERSALAGIGPARPPATSPS